MKYRGHPNRLLRGIVIDGTPTSQGNCDLRSGALIFNADNVDKEIGWVTSATFAPTLAKEIALGYVRIAVTEPGSRVQIQTPDRWIEGTVVLLPFST